jgi:hypothetical protein
MPTKAKVYIGVIVVLGFALLTGVLSLQPRFPDLPRYLSYLLLALLASTLKVRFPGITGTISVNFLFILIGIANFTMSESLALGAAAILIQCLWRTRCRPRLIQVAFNVAALTISIAAAYQVSHFTLALARADSLSALLALAASVYFVSNTLLISGVLCLIEGKPLKQIWEQCYLWTFPYYLIGSAIAGLVTVSSRAIGWEGALLVLPLMYLVYTFYRLYVDRMSPEPDRFTMKSPA